MHKSIASLLIVSLFLAAPIAADDLWESIFRSDDGSGNIVSEMRDLDSFSKISVSGGLDVVVEVGESQSVEVTFHDNLIDRVKTDVRGRTLKIYSKESFSTRRPCKIRITVPTLEEVVVSGSGDVEVFGIKNDFFEYRVSGSGDLRAEGEVRDLVVGISGSGDVDARELRADNVEVHVSGSGDAKVYAKENLDASITGSGDITCYGNPVHVSRHVSGSGDIIKRR